MQGDKFAGKSHLQKRRQGRAWRAAVSCGGGEGWAAQRKEKMRRIKTQTNEVAKMIIITKQSKERCELHETNRLSCPESKAEGGAKDKKKLGLWVFFGGVDADYKDKN